MVAAFVTMLFFAFLALVVIFLISSFFCLLSSGSLVYVLLFGSKRIWRNTVINFDNTFDVWLASVLVALTSFYSDLTFMKMVRTQAVTTTMMGWMMQ